MINVLAILMTIIALAAPVLIIVLPIVVVMRMLGLTGSGSYNKSVPMQQQQDPRKLEDEIVKAQWHYDNVWKRRQ